VLNAADEVAVSAFLDRRIRFTDIVPLVQQVLQRHRVVREPDVEQLERADQWARQEAHRCLTA
jgi:1-deoxy-D-xylulose-5-phosphate reductoisomerase